MWNFELLFLQNMSGGCLCSKHIEKRLKRHFFLLENTSAVMVISTDHFIVAASTPSVYYNLIYYVFSTPASPALPFLTLHLIVLQPGNCICLGHTIPVPCKLCVQKLFMINFPSSFLFFMYKNCSPIISWLAFTILYAVLKTLHFWSFHCITFSNLFLSDFYIWPDKQFSLPLRAYFSHLLREVPAHNALFEK